jgi:ubiquitin fusion degradation protein 1
LQTPKPCTLFDSLTNISLEQELTNYSCLFKGDTININYQGRDYLIDIVECKPDD